MHVDLVCEPEALVQRHDTAESRRPLPVASLAAESGERVSVPASESQHGEARVRTARAARKWKRQLRAEARSGDSLRLYIRTYIAARLHVESILDGLRPAK